LIANYPAWQLHIIIRHTRTSARPFTLRFAILDARVSARGCVSVSIRFGVSRVVERRRNRCTRQRDADRRAIPPFFFRCSPSRFSPSLCRPLSLFPLRLFRELSRSCIHRPLLRSSPLESTSLSLSNLQAFIAAATWLPVAGIFGRTSR